MSGYFEKFVITSRIPERTRQLYILKCIECGKSALKEGKLYNIASGRYGDFKQVNGACNLYYGLYINPSRYNRLCKSVKSLFIHSMFQLEKHREITELNSRNFLSEKSIPEDIIWKNPDDILFDEKYNTMCIYAMCYSEKGVYDIVYGIFRSRYINLQIRGLYNEDCNIFIPFTKETQTIVITEHFVHKVI